MATWALGAMPEMAPRETSSSSACTLAFPAAVLAVWVPCPSESLGESNSSGSNPIRALYVSRNFLAPSSLLLQRKGADPSSAASQTGAPGIQERGSR